MQRRSFIAGCAFAPLVVAGCNSTPSIDDQLESLMELLGMTGDQAAGGLGSVLTLAQEKLVPSDFDKIAAAIPGADGYLDRAKDLGAVTGPLGDLVGLNGALGRLGIDSQTAARFVPAVTDMVAKAGGSEVGSLLSGAMRT